MARDAILCKSETIYDNLKNKQYEHDATRLLHHRFSRSGRLLQISDEDKSRRYYIRSYLAKHAFPRCHDGTSRVADGFDLKPAVSRMS